MLSAERFGDSWKRFACDGDSKGCSHWEAAARCTGAGHSWQVAKRTGDLAAMGAGAMESKKTASESY